jgi:hypothetical protein
MSNDLKFELKLKQLDDAVKRLEQYKAKGWDIMVRDIQVLIVKLETELDKLESLM